MTTTTAVWAVGILVTSIVSFFGYIMRKKWDKVDDIENRLTKVETKLDVLGDISTTLHRLRTDVEIIKVQMEKYK